MVQIPPPSASAANPIGVRAPRALRSPFALASLLLITVAIAPGARVS